MLPHIFVGGVRILAALGRTTGGRVGLRFARGVTNHTAGQLAKKGCRRIAPKAYERMSPSEIWVVDQATDFAVRAATDIARQGIEIYVSEEEIDGLAQRYAISLQDAIVRASQSRTLSTGYDSFFGKVDRGGRLVVNLDLLKQMILAGIGEILNDAVATT